MRACTPEINPTDNAAPIGPDQIGDRDALTFIIVHCLLTSCTVALNLRNGVIRRSLAPQAARARQGEAMNLINAKYGSEPGLKAYTHVSDQFGPFATQNIPATVSEAPYILDGLLMNEAGRKITEQYADTGGFTDHVFAVTSLLGFRFIPRTQR